MILSPKEKAEELVYKFMDTHISWKQSKQCALIAVDEILKQLSPLDLSPLGTYTNPKIEYWLDVKDEIQNL